MTKPPSRASTALWISGFNPVREALLTARAEILEMIVARSDQRIRELVELSAQRGIAPRQETRDALSARVGHSHHQGVALRMREYPYLALEALMEKPPGEREPLVILDCIQDPQNLGALIRSACFLGARGVIIPQDRSAQVTETVVKIAAGATAYLPVVRVNNLVRTLEQLKEHGLWIFGLDVQGAKTIYDADLSVPLGLVIGNEQKGLRPLVAKACDVLVRIPEYGPLQSLNAATSGAIALAEAQRRRLTGK
jgi:23S rRNA (guanosine2251-2'-O)-methyltransferase